MIQFHWSRTKLVYISAKRAAFKFRQANDDAMVFDATLSTLCVSNCAREAVKSETDFHRNRAADSAVRPSTALKEDSVHFAKVLKATERDSVSRGQIRWLRFLRSTPSNHLSHMRWHFDFFFQPSKQHFRVCWLCTFETVEAYLSEIGCERLKWKQFAYAQLFSSLSPSLLEKKAFRFEFNRLCSAFQSWSQANAKS